MESEPTENFEILLNLHLEKFGPVDGVEFGMIEEMASSYWRQRRAWAIEKQMFDQAMLNQPDTLPGLSAAFGELAETHKLQLLYRYQTALHRTYQRALYNLLLLRDIKPDDAKLRNEPSPISGQHEPPVSLAPSGQEVSQPGGSDSAPAAVAQAMPVTAAAIAPLPAPSLSPRHMDRHAPEPDPVPDGPQPSVPVLPPGPGPLPARRPAADDGATLHPPPRICRCESL